MLFKIKKLIDPYNVGPWSEDLGFFTITVLFLLSAALCFLFLGGAFQTVLGILYFFNIGIHEAGHPIFYILGGGNKFLHVAGGTLMELIVPSFMGICLLRQGKGMQAAVCQMWLGYSFISIGRYAKSTSLPEVTLLGGSESDWEYLHTLFGTYNYDVQIGNILYFAGSLFIVFGVYIFVKKLLKTLKNPIIGNGF
ncbi:hypothetical protein Emin_0643 [Elusimicrobium minutum Pei191]|uniref:Uncharacterized protein n=1 Tax=Elusimicrobium minutum (strain Pei191) TaxID=445932 RepID=B2KC71_ELUMP|nr:hypothetical protein [Elusimicrobium minutum]ACC98198.1 hypothetical protein Emin_0643 [Elusimicrobium minutum Pei191]